ncbi:MAG: MFS transporter [Pontibacterium sp.]
MIKPLSIGPVVSPATATRLAFLIAGFAVACWAPLIPWVKVQLELSEARLGLLLLCLGLGALSSMILSSIAIPRWGCKRVILSSGIGVLVSLSLLPFWPSFGLMAFGLLAFGISLGAIDVAMNIQAAAVEKAENKAMMSGFHALFSLGNVAGAGTVTLLLTLGVAAQLSTVIAAAIVAVALFASRSGLIDSKRGNDDPHFALPKGGVLVLAMMASIAFLAEGSMLDWSALLLIEQNIAPEAQAGIGFLMFNLAMTLGRLTGDKLATRLGDHPLLVGGLGLAILGFVTLLFAPMFAPMAWLQLASFLLIGFGLANLVPILFRMAGQQTYMPVALAIAAVSCFGYSGGLLGPVALGFIAEHSTVWTAFVCLSGLIMLLMALAFALPNKAATSQVQST